MTTFLKKEFEDNGFECTEIIENVLLVKNFANEKELNSILDIIKNTPEENWFIEYTKNLSRFCLEKFGRDDVENLVAEGKFEVTKGWQDKNLSIVNSKISKMLTYKLNKIVKLASQDLVSDGVVTIQRMQHGVELKSHTDQHTDPSIMYAAVLYLNNDYVNGEVFFVNKNISLRPDPGSLLVFPGNDEFEHGVKHVGEGPIRYVIPTFIKIVDFYKNNKY